MIASYVEEHHRQWDKWLAEFRFAINSAWHESTGFTPAEVALRWKLKGPLERALQLTPNPGNYIPPSGECQKDLIKRVKENVVHKPNRKNITTNDTSRYSIRSET